MKTILKIIAFPFVVLAVICASPIVAWLVLFYFTREDGKQIVKQASDGIS